MMLLALFLGVSVTKIAYVTRTSPIVEKINEIFPLKKTDLEIICSLFSKKLSTLDDILLIHKSTEKWPFLSF
jgi:hypothetical protein